MINFLLICTLLMPCCVALMPFSKNIFFLALVMVLLGFNMGCVDNIANLAILKLHSNNVSPYIQVKMLLLIISIYFVILITKYFIFNRQCIFFMDWELF